MIHDVRSVYKTRKLSRTGCNKYNEIGRDAVRLIKHVSIITIRERMVILWSRLLRETRERLSLSTGGSAQTVTRLECSGLFLPSLVNLFWRSRCTEPRVLADSRSRVSVNRLDHSTCCCRAAASKEGRPWSSSSFYCKICTYIYTHGFVTLQVSRISIHHINYVHVQ